MRAQNRPIQYLLDRGLKTVALHIENDFPDALQSFLGENSVTVHLCPPNGHHTNQSEKAIDTWKCHFLEGLSGADPSFPMHLWDRLLPQATQTLNLLRRSGINPRLSTEA